MIQKYNQNNDERKQENRKSIKRFVAGCVLIVTTVCLGASGFYLYQTYKEGKDKQKTTTTYIESKEDKKEVNNTVDKDSVSDNKQLQSESSKTDTSTNDTLDNSNTDKDINEDTNKDTNKDTNQDINKDTNQDINQNTNNDTDEKKDTPTNDQQEEEKKVPPCKVKGIYVTGPMAGSTNNMKKLINLVDKTELNTMVIDIKNDSGEITCQLDNNTAKEINAITNYISNIEELVKTLKEKNVYLIARIVAFKDPILAEKKPDLSIKNANGTIFRDRSNLAWVNPYKKEVWEYLVSLGKEAAELGFDEIQYDYIRFSTDKGMKQTNFGVDTSKKTKIETITEFTKYAYEQLSPLGVYVSADVYGTIINSDVDAKIVGQSYVEMAKYLDYICPMIYPSHYGNGVYGIKYPDLEPYLLIKSALEDSKEVLKAKEKGEHQAVVRPWLQDFTATWIDKYQKYGASEIREQIKGVYDAGYEEWILWNGSNRYTESGLKKK